MRDENLELPVDANLSGGPEAAEVTSPPERGFEGSPVVEVVSRQEVQAAHHLAPAGSDGEDGAAEDSELTEAILSPAKVIRIGSMLRQLREEVRAAPLDEAGRQRLAEIYEISVRELAESVSPDLREELSALAIAFDTETPTEAELRIAQAQLVGWLEGVFHGIQAAVLSQQVSRSPQPNNQLPAPPQAPGPTGNGAQGGVYL